MTNAQVKAITEFIEMFSKEHIKEDVVIHKLEITCNNGNNEDVTLYIKAGLPDAPEEECIASLVGIGYDGYIVGYSKKMIKLEGLTDNLYQ